MLKKWKIIFTTIIFNFNFTICYTNSIIVPYTFMVRKTIITDTKMPIIYTGINYNNKNIDIDNYLDEIDK